ncbi:MAG: hypothetical protein RLZZ143_2542 [Cyanobacteriota bacterium]|jgi:hypothetical protein
MGVGCWGVGRKKSVKFSRQLSAILSLRNDKHFRAEEESMGKIGSLRLVAKISQ